LRCGGGECGGILFLGNPPMLKPKLSRRQFVAGSLTAAAAGSFSIIRTTPAFAADPFTLGIASGCPRANRVVLWTRLAPDPLNGGGMGDAPVEVDWEIAADERFAVVVARGTETAAADFAHSVRVEAGGLSPSRWYWYRFRAGNAISPVGRTRTAPAEMERPGQLRFAVASCQQYEQGYFSAYRHMAGQDLDFVLHLGDYIYENSWGTRHVRKHQGGIPTMLYEFRDRYALYKSDADLQAAHAAFPWLAIWDDHEVSNDYSDDRTPKIPDAKFFLGVRAAAYQAWYEHMPVPPSMAPRGHQMRIYDRYNFGGLMELLLLDDRQYRSPHACLAVATANLRADCPERLEPSRTMLGGTQEDWLDAQLQSSNAAWTFIGQQTLMAELDRKAGEGHAYWMDGWDGYAASRDRLLQSVANHKPGNPVVLGGDVHSFWVTDLKRDFAGPASPTLATEIVTSSITSDGPSPEAVRVQIEENPHVRYGRGDMRGYATFELKPNLCTIGFEGVDDVKREGSPTRRFAAFAVESGRPGAQPV
jgi:alkaline phosphatase D